MATWTEVDGKAVVNVGTIPNDTQGDTLRDGMRKINHNFTELYTNAVISSNLTVACTAFNITSSALTLNTALKDANANTGTSGYFLTSNNTNIIWENTVDCGTY
jgi:hypothetical protein